MAIKPLKPNMYKAKFGSSDVMVVNSMTLKLQLSGFESWPLTSCETLGELFNAFVIEC